MRRLVFLILALCFVSLSSLEAQTNNKSKESSVLLSYYHSFGNVVYSSRDFTNGVVLSYLRDYSIPNTPLFFGFGASLGFAHYSYINDYNTKGYLNSYYFGIPLTAGFKIALSHSLLLKPFFRLMPILEYYNGEQSGSYVVGKPSKFAFGGVAPELGATLCVSRFIVSLSYGFTWDTYSPSIGYTRLGEHGIYLGVGYLF